MATTTDARAGGADAEDGAIYDTIEIEDMDFDETKGAYFYPCPCGDRFSITLEELRAGEEIATCPSCSLRIKVVYDQAQFVEFDDGD